MHCFENENKKAILFKYYCSKEINRDALVEQSHDTTGV